MGSTHGRRGLPGLFAITTVLVAATSLAAAGPVAAAGPGGPSGFSQPFAGVPRYVRLAPPEATNARQVNRPLGRRAADRIARRLGIDRRLVFTQEQYELFITGRGIGGDPSQARLVDESVRIFINTRGNPMWVVIDGKPTPTVLASYGVFVNEDGMLMSPANTDAPTRQVNVVIEPGGYLHTWCRDNGCERSLLMLDRSAYPLELPFGIASQAVSGVAQLVTNTKPGGRTSKVGMSMAPSIWIINFLLVYVLNPDLAAQMPAYWTPLPDDVAAALEASSDGQVPYAEVSDSFPGGHHRHRRH